MTLQSMSAHACLCLPMPAYACLCLPMPAYACLCLPMPAHACKPPATHDLCTTTHVTFCRHMTRCHVIRQLILLSFATAGAD